MTTNSSDRGSDVDHVGRSADRCHPWRMRKLLLLLPALALASCSGGHDLMSNKSFSMTCDAHEISGMPSPYLTATVSPELPQASVRWQVYEDIWSDAVWRVAVATPTRLELINTTSRIVGRIRIERSSGKVATFLSEPILETDWMSCSFKTL